jgi:hypothetical protein
MMMIVEQSVECELAGDTKVLKENLPWCHFVHHKSHDLIQATTVESQRLTT